MMVPKQLAKTMELIFVRSMPTTGAVAVMVIGSPAAAQSPKAEKYRLKRMQTACRTGVASSISSQQSKCFCCYANACPAIPPVPHKPDAAKPISDIRPKTHLDDGVVRDLEEI